MAKSRHLLIIPWEMDAATLRFTRVGPEVEGLLGYPLARWNEPTFWADHLHPADRDATLQRFRTHLESGEGFELDFRMMGTEGQIVSLQGIVQFLRDAAGRQLARGYLIDTTVRLDSDSTHDRMLREDQVIFDSVPALIWYKDADNKILRANRVAAESVGLTVSEIEGKSTYDLYPDEAAKYHQDDLEVIRSGQPRYGIIEQLQRSDGEKIWVRTDKIPYRDEKGNVVGVIVFAVDITHLKQAEEQLRFVLSGARCLLWHATVDDELGHNVWHVHISNEEAAQQFLPLKLAPGQTYTDAWERSKFPEDVQRMDENSSTAFREGRYRYSQEFRCVNADGEVRWLYEDVHVQRIAPLRWMVVGVCTDVTDNTVTMEALKASEERYRKFFEEDLTGDYICKPDGRLLACNSAFARIFGFSSVIDAMNFGMQPLFPSPKAFDDFVDGIQRQRKLEYYEHELRRRDRQPVFCVENAIGIFDEEGNIAEIKGYIFDNTRLKQLESQMIEAQKMEAIGRLAGGIAHDFNNLLTSILGFSQLIADRTPDGDATRKDAEHIIQAGERAANLTRQLLALGRKQMIQLRALSLNNVLGSMEQILRRTLGESVDLTVNLDPHIGSIEADEGQIDQVITNLALNARDAMPNGGKLIIRTSPVTLDAEYCARHIGTTPGPYVMLAIRDTGTGMAEGVREHVFEPFFTTKPKHKGTGLGLSTVYGIVRQSRGHIEFDTEVGKGTEFRVYFPMTGAPPEPAAKKPKDAAPKGRETILVVEDEDMVRNLAVRMLTSLNYKVLEARNGREALDVCEKHADPIDLVLSDVVMPHMSGPQFVERLRKMRSDFKVLYTSGFNEEQLFEHGGPRDRTAQLLPKPYTREALAQRIRQVIDGVAAS
jgi:two-component system cell cycle sensor histidine kinase/response regulator CckA